MRSAVFVDPRDHIICGQGGEAEAEILKRERPPDGRPFRTWQILFLLSRRPDAQFGDISDYS
jgi:hypothetical protein